MNALPAFAGQELWHIAGWTMLHFLWLGTLTAILALAARLLLRRAASNVRYATALCCLALLAASPIAIAAWLTISPAHPLPLASVARPNPTPTSTTPTIELTNPATIPSGTTSPEPAPTPTPNNTAAPPSNSSAAEQHLPGEQLEHAAPSNPRQSRGLIRFQTTLEACVPYLPWLWLIGTPLTFALLAAGIIGTKRLRDASRAVDDPQIHELLARLQKSLRIGKRVTIAVCDRIASPVLLGIVRPMILLPPAALTGWSPDEIEMVLLHELAHVRRWDNLVNLIQRLIESLLFFHPAVWLISTWVRREREQCCDALVVHRTDRPHAYAELLLNLAAAHSPLAGPPLAGLAFAQHPLRTRIRRILQLEDDPMLISGKSLTLTLAAILVATTLAVLYLPTIGKAEESAADSAESSEPISEQQPDVKNSPSDSAETYQFNASPALEDTEQLQSLFDVTDQNPLVTRIYEVSPSQERTLPRVFEGLQQDPHGPQLKFTADWGGQRVRIRAPKAAHQKFFARLTEQPSQKSTRETTESTEENKDAAKSDSKNSSTDDSPVLVPLSDPNAAAGAPSHNEDAESAKKQEVVAEFPSNVSIETLVQAYQKAQQDKQYVELVNRDNGQALVVVPQPTEANWPDFLGESPRKDRVIAEKAYARLGLKLVPLNNAEAMSRQVMGKSLGVQIVGGNVPKGLPLPSLLTSVGGDGLNNMDNLLLWLESEAGKSTNSVKCRATADDKEYLFDAAPPAETVESKPQPPPPSPRYASKSPSTATADRILVAYEIPGDLADEVKKMPNVQGVWDERGRYVMQATPERHKQFKSLLEATPKWRDPAAARKRSNSWIVLKEAAGKTILEWHTQGVSFKKDEGQDGVTVVTVAPGSPAAWHDIQPGDTLKNIDGFSIGSLAELESVLRSFVKGFASASKTLGMYFYRELPDGRRTSIPKLLLLRPDHPDAPSNLQESLQLEQLRAMEMMRQQQESQLPPPSDPNPVLKQDDKPPTSNTPSPPDNGFDRVMTERVMADGRKVYEERVVPRTTKNESPAPPRVLPVSPPLDPPTLYPVSPPPIADAPSYEPTPPEKEDAPPPKPRSARSRTRTAPPSNKRDLRYDGKSFDEWRDLWQNELSGAKRAEAVRALAAFARAGYGKEATGLILDVAGNYDFLILSQDAEGKLKKTVLDELVADSHSSDLAKYWLPDLVERLKKDPEKWQSLVVHLVQRLPTKDPNVLATVQSLAQNGPAAVRLDALSALVRNTTSQTPDGAFSLDEKTHQLLTDTLSDDDPARIQSALQLLLRYPGSSGFGGGFGGGGGMVPPPKLMYQPELVPLLFHADEPTRQQARYVLQYITNKDAPQVVEQLLAVLKDDARKKDHLHAIRALAAMGKKSQTSTPDLAKALTQSDDKEILVAGVVALTHIAGQPTLRSVPEGEPVFDTDSLSKAVNKLLSPNELESLGKGIGGEKDIAERLLREDQAIFPPTNPPQLGGGGGFF